MEKGRRMATPELIDKAKTVLADTFVMYMKAHSYHWNVIGPDFPQLHEFFGNLYEDLHGAVDPLAEHVRALDAFAPATLIRMTELSSVKEDEKIPTTQNMISNLLDANDIVMKSLDDTRKKADEDGMFGYVNFLEERMMIHAKHRWMLKSIESKK
jgi:starvation-inducible DNA-binding protein